ncbi:MAG: hypothetical protein ACREO3_09590, partial [Arenimonas sp.]
LVQWHADGRLDVAALGSTLQRMLACPALKPARLRRSFDAALRLEPALTSAIVPMLVAVVSAAPEAPRGDLATLLELLHELLVTQARPVPAAVREPIAALALSGTARSLQRKVLGLGAATV